MGDVVRRVDLQHHFMTEFNSKTGRYLRTGIIENGVDTDREPFMASFPHLIDVGIMGHCEHGKSGLCAKAGIGCYQSGLHVQEPNMSLEDFKRIADECEFLVDQFALGGRGDPDCHEHFEEILAYCQEKNIVPNYTTSGFGFTKEKAALSKQYCGAVAVSWYRSEYTLRAIDLLLEAGVRTNIHYVLGKNSIEEAIERLESNDFPIGINAIVFLLHKPVGQGSKANSLDINHPLLGRFFKAAVETPHPFKIGFDSCTVPGIVNYSSRVDLRSVDTCEGGRFSMYISSDMVAVPCSFDAVHRYGVDLHGHTIMEAWESQEFDAFRQVMRSSCPTCEKREYCLGGCPLQRDIVLCQPFQSQRAEK